MALNRFGFLDRLASLMANAVAGSICITLV